MRSNPRNLAFFESVIDELKKHPEKKNIVKQNIQEYKQQIYLKRGFLKALERVEWVFDGNQDIDSICEQIMAHDYIGNRIRRYPLIFKNVLDTSEQ